MDPPLQVSQQAVSERLRTPPASLFGLVAHAILPQLQARSAARSRPVAPAVARAQRHFAHLWIADATKLEALFKKVGALREVEGYPHGGTLLGLLDLPSKLPVHLAWDADSALNERRLLDRVKDLLVPRTLLLIDGGFYGFGLFDWCTDHEVSFLTRPAANAAYAVVRVLQETETLRDRISVEMVYRGLYHFAGAVQRGEATDPVAYLASQTDLGIVKRLRNRRTQRDNQRQILNL